MFRAAIYATVIGVAAAFAPATPALRMSASDGISRRDAVQAGVAGAVVIGGASAASAQPVIGRPAATSKKAIRMKGGNFAPVITIIDHRGCKEHANKEYRGPKSDDENDEMVVIVKNVLLKRDDPRFVEQANSVLAESLTVMANY